MIRVALYARVSLADGSQTTDNQLLELRQFVAAKASEGWKLQGEYIDHASGKNADRTQFQQMMQDADKRRFDLLLFWSLDRLSREGALETLKHLERLNGSGVEWWSYREEYLRSIGPFRDAVLAILATIAKQERLRLSERVKAGVSRARSQGKRLGRPRRVFDRAKAQELLAAGGTYRSVARELGVASTVLFAGLKEKPNEGRKVG